MAAVAALGRDAFVALPDVKPITAMTFVVGYALGPLPGFTVGALGMLASNIMLGQGPYTPWQMAAWGLVGLAGAALGRLSRRRLGRVPLALGCAVAALVAKEIMNVYTWTLGASHTPRRSSRSPAQALPYDITDVVASSCSGWPSRRAGARARADARAHGGRVGGPLPHPREASPLGGEEPPPLVRRLLGPAMGAARAAACLAARDRGVSALRDSPTPDRSRRRPAHGRRRRARPGRAARLASREVSLLAAAQNTDGGFGGARGRPAASCTRPGWRSGSPPPGATR